MTLTTRHSHLRDKIQSIESREYTLSSLVHHLGESALMMICVIAITPFLQPIPLPGISTVLGAIIIFQGIGLVFNSKIILTKKMQQVVISKEKIELLKNTSIKILNLIYPFIKSRGEKYVSLNTTRITTGINITLLAIFLSLPLPIPTSNFLPAVGILALCLGVLERDLILILIGNIYSAVLYILIYLSFDLVKISLEKLFN